MPVCFAPGCNTGYSSTIRRNKATGGKNPSIFSAPKESEILEKWRRAIPRKDKVFETTDKLCERHFEEECVEKEFKTTLSDGTIFTLARVKPVLKPGSIPTIFPNLPKYLSSKTLKRKVPSNRSSSFKKNKPNVNFIEDVQSSIEIQEQHNSLFDIFHSLVNVQKPDSWWTVAPTQEHIICAKWNSKYSHERRVVICQDFSAKIFLRNVEISLNVGEVNNVESLSCLLQLVNDLIICKNAESGMTTGCLGYLSAEKKQTLCDMCNHFMKRQNDI